MKIRKIVNTCFISILLLLLVSPAVLTNWKPEQISKTENRMLAELTPMSEGFSSFTTSLNACANDRIGFRDQMVRLYNEITVNFLHSRNDQVVMGEEGWLFYIGDLPDYTGKTNTPENVEYCVQVLKKLDAWCKEQGSQLVFLVGPNKASVYDEYMPDYIRRTEESLLDVLTVRLREEGILLINPKDALNADAASRELYYKLDTHWNANGARYALDGLVELLGLPGKDFSTKDYRINSGDLLKMLAIDDMGSYSLYTAVEKAPETVIERIPDSKHKQIHNPAGIPFLCYRDSFAIALENYFSHYFDGPMYWSWEVMKEPPEKLPPYVIVECVERFILTAMKTCEASMELS